MKIIINENQLKQIIESENKKKLLSIPIELFYNKMDSILNNYRKKGFNGIKLVGNVKFYSVDFDRIFEHIVEIDGNLDVSHSKITSLGNLKSVGGYLDLENTPIESLGSLESVDGDLYLVDTPIESLGELESVGGGLNLKRTPIESLGELKSVGGDLTLNKTPLGGRLKSKMSKDEIKNKFGVNGNLYI